MDGHESHLVKFDPPFMLLQLLSSLPLLTLHPPVIRLDRHPIISLAQPNLRVEGGTYLLRGRGYIISGRDEGEECRERCIVSLEGDEELGSGGEGGHGDDVPGGVTSRSGANMTSKFVCKS